MTRTQQVQAPAAVHLGWDMQFTRIAKYAAPRVVRVLQGLAEECLIRGFPVRIANQLADDSTASTMTVSDMGGTPVLHLSITLSDGWALRKIPGAQLSFEMRCLLTGHLIPLELYRFSHDCSCDPATVFFNAGDHVDMEVLRRALVGLL